MRRLGVRLNHWVPGCCKSSKIQKKGKVPYGKQAVHKIKKVVQGIEFGNHLERILSLSHISYALNQFITIELIGGEVEMK